MAVQTFNIASDADDERLSQDVSNPALFWGWGVGAGGFTNRIIGGRNNTVLYGGWWRFTNVTVAQGTTITSAILTLNNGGIGANQGTAAQIAFYCEDADNPTMPTSANDARDRPRTSGVAFSPAPTTGTWTFDITSIVQEIINRPGFASGNALSVVMLDNGSPATFNYIVSSQREISTSESAKLTITTPDAGNPWYYYANQAAAL